MRGVGSITTGIHWFVHIYRCKLGPCHTCMGFLRLVHHLTLVHFFPSVRSWPAIPHAAI